MGTGLTKEKIKRFVNDRDGKGSERAESQTFWLTLLRDVLEIKNPEQFITFEIPIPNGRSSGFIDGYIAQTKVLIEQK